MDNLLSLIEGALEYIKRTLERFRDFLKSYNDTKRKMEIENCIARLDRLDAVYKCSANDLKYIEQYDKDKHDYYWIVDYHHKYLFGRDE